MIVPLQLTFQGMEPSEALQSATQQHAQKLEELFDNITSCRVVISAAHRRHQHGNLYSVRVDLTVPDAELVASREPDADTSHEDVYVALRDSFNAIRRQLASYTKKRRGKVKRHRITQDG